MRIIRTISGANDNFGRSKMFNIVRQRIVPAIQLAGNFARRYIAKMKAFEWNLARPLVMGILNVTPDSFTDGGRYSDVASAVAQARQMAEAGADIIDLGGESTRPGAPGVSAEEELRRVLPVVEQIQDLLVSVDTTKAIVAQRALAAGARIVNDISALQQDADMLPVVRDSGAGVVLMHRQGRPATMQDSPRYTDVRREVREFLAARIEFALAGGIKKSQIAVDPGLGFGKTTEHNWQLLTGLEQFATLGCPILIGASRKSFIGQLLGRPANERLPGSLAVAAWAVLHGAQIVRAHDVSETADVVRLITALRSRN